jgi:hypothetical protein
MFDGLKRKVAAGAIMSVLRSLATSKDTRTSITGIVAAGVLACKGLDVAALVAGDPVQIAHVISCVLVALIGVLATKENADGKTTLLGAVAGALYAAQGDVDTVATGVVIAALGHFTNKVVPARGPAEG